MFYLDTETCGLVGPIVLIQYAEDDGPVTLYEPWQEPVHRTLSLIERLCDGTICAFNLSFDWFHINKFYNLLSTLPKHSSPTIERVAAASKLQPTKYCLKPRRCLDLFLYSRRTEWQTLMDRRNIRIRKVPTEIASRLASVLTRSLSFKDIYFKRRRDGYEWQAEVRQEEPQWSDIVLRFGASGGLKALVEEIFKTTVLEYPLPKSMYPDEHSYNPYDTGWTKVIKAHIHHWRVNKTSRGYAENDIIYLQRLYHHWGEPPTGDTDSELAACVGAVRWKGFSIDKEAVAERLIDRDRAKGGTPTAPTQALRWLHEVAPPTVKMAIKSTDKNTLETICKTLDETGVPSALQIRAAKIMTARKAEKEIDVLSKLLKVGRFNPDFKVIGAKSGRMSGGSSEGITGGSLNPQGINRSSDFRSLFKLADKDSELSGGDFESFEVCIAAAWSDDKGFNEELRSGIKPHVKLGMLIYDEDYDGIMGNKELYTPAKNTMYAQFYGADIPKQASTAGVEEEVIKKAFEAFMADHVQYATKRKEVIDAFCTMDQPEPNGPIYWKEPADYVDSMFGDRRYFTLENRVIRSLFKLAQHPPKELDILGKVLRRNRKQTILGAIRSALYAACFNLQAVNMRAAANHVIQGTGAKATKIIQEAIWDLQPAGVHEWLVQPMNIHDEIMCVHKPSMRYIIADKVRETIDKLKETIPLIKMDWKNSLKDWSEK